ncbi:MAG: PspC domain-containing protein [Xanthomonadales bacterium]|nr:PspC domain-containing protein [Xanthomonadales bacterium]
MNHDDDYPRTQRFYRDTDRGVILGVCAGIAEHFGWPLWLTRLASLALAWVFTMPTVIAYLIAAMLMPERPLRFDGDGDERGFWQSQRQRSEP